MQTKYRELTYEEACTLYDCGLRDGVQFMRGDSTWMDDTEFHPQAWDSKIPYRIALPAEE